MLGLHRFLNFLDLHIAKFFGIKDLATLQAFDELDVVMPGHNAHAWVFAEAGHGSKFDLNSGDPSLVISCHGLRTNPEPIRPVGKPVHRYPVL